MLRVFRSACLLVVAGAVAWWLLQTGDSRSPIEDAATGSIERRPAGLRSAAPKRAEPKAPTALAPPALPAPAEGGSGLLMPETGFFTQTGTRLRLRFEEAPSRGAPVGPLTVQVRDESGSEVQRASYVLGALQRWSRTSVLLKRPGRYTVTVTSEAYVQKEPCTVVVKKDWTQHARVLLLPSDEAAWIDVRVELPARWHDVRRDFVVVGRREQVWYRLTPRAVHRTEGKFRIGPLVPGRWELIVWAGAPYVGRAVIDAAGARSEVAHVRVGAGHLVPLVTEQPKGFFYSDWYKRPIDVTLITGQGTTVPALWWRAHQKHLFWRRGENQFPASPRIGTRVPCGAVLGPYPYEDLSARWPADLRTLLK